MNIIYRKFAVILACAAFLSNISAQANDNNSGDISNRSAYSRTMSAPSNAGRIYGEWIILSANGRTINLRDSAPYININSTDKKIYGEIGVNVINATFDVPEKGAISISDVEATRMPSSNVREENDIKTGLSEACTYTIAKKKNDIYYLDILDKRGNVVIHAKRHNADIMSGVWKLDRLNGNDISSQNLEIVVDVPELKIHGNSGCNIFNGDIGLDRNKDWFIQFQNIIMSRMRCDESKMAVERDLMVALEEVEIIKRENNGKTIRLLDKNKTEILLLKKVENNN